MTAYYKNISTMSDDAIIQYIGDFIKHNRLEQNITQQELANKAGVNRTTISDLESGKRFQILTLIQVLRILNLLHVFQAFEVNKKISPLLLAEMEMKYHRQRARNKKKDSDNPPQTDW